MNMFYSDSKTVLKLQCDCSIKLDLFEGAHDFVTRLTAVCCMLLPHNPYRLPHHYKRHVCGPYCSCKHRFLWISLIFEHQFCLNYMGYSTPLTTFLVKKEFLFHRPVLIFQPTVNCRSSNNRSTQCQNLISQLGKMSSYEVATFISVFVEGFRRQRGTFWLLNESLIFKGTDDSKSQQLTKQV